MYKLYVFARSDMESMTPGKLAAQVAHAASQCARDAYISGPETAFGEAYSQWEKSGADGFGTTIVLDVYNMNDIVYDVAVAENLMPSTFDMADAMAGGVVHDPSYPVRDGDVTHLIPLDTCYWAFDDPDKNPVFAEYVSRFSLY